MGGVSWCRCDRRAFSILGLQGATAEYVCLARDAGCSAPQRAGGAASAALPAPRCPPPARLKSRVGTSLSSWVIGVVPWPYLLDPLVHVVVCFRPGTLVPFWSIPPCQFPLFLLDLLAVRPCLSPLPLQEFMSASSHLSLGRGLQGPLLLSAVPNPLPHKELLAFFFCLSPCLTGILSFDRRRGSVQILGGAAQTALLSFRTPPVLRPQLVCRPGR